MNNRETPEWLVDELVDIPNYTLFIYNESLKHYLEIFIQHDKNVNPYVSLSLVPFINGNMDYSNQISLANISISLFIRILTLCEGYLFNLTNLLVEKYQQDIYDNPNLLKVSIIYDEEDLLKLVDDMKVGKADYRDYKTFLNFYIDNNNQDITEISKKIKIIQYTGFN